MLRLTCCLCVAFAAQAATPLFQMSFEKSNGGWAVVLRTSWRSVAGKTAFQSAATSMTGHLPGPAVVCADGSGVALYVASDVTALEALAPCRPPL